VAKVKVDANSAPITDKHLMEMRAALGNCEIDTGSLVLTLDMLANNAEDDEGTTVNKLATLANGTVLTNGVTVKQHADGGKYIETSRTWNVASIYVGENIHGFGIKKVSGGVLNNLDNVTVDGNRKWYYTPQVWALSPDVIADAMQEIGANGTNYPMLKFKILTIGQDSTNIAHSGYSVLKMIDDYLDNGKESKLANLGVTSAWGLMIDGSTIDTSKALFNADGSYNTAYPTTIKTRTLEYLVNRGLAQTFENAVISDDQTADITPIVRFKNVVTLGNVKGIKNIELRGAYDSRGSNPASYINGIPSTVSMFRIANIADNIDFSFNDIDIAEFGPNANLSHMKVAGGTFAQIRVRKSNMSAWTDRNSTKIANIMVWDNAGSQYKAAGYTGFTGNFQIDDSGSGYAYSNTMYDADIYDVYKHALDPSYMTNMTPYADHYAFAAANPGRVFANQAEIDGLDPPLIP
jgi:hypothetical protein